MTLKEAATNSLLMFVAATCVVLIVKAVSPTPSGPVAAAGNSVINPTPAITDGFKVYYLHGNIRCPTCRTIESTAQEAVQTGFVEQLKSGQLEWQVINYESPGNERYMTDYEVVAPSVVMAEFAGGQQKKWKAIPEVWELVNDQAAFIELVQNKLREFMDGTTASPAPDWNLPLPSPADSKDTSDLPIPD
jgi:hypothetical protein